MFKTGDRIKFKNKTFLSNGTIIETIHIFDEVSYLIKLDEKAPNEYVWNTDEILELDSYDLEYEN